MEHTNETIGPEEAQVLLDKLMPNYRPLDERQVEDYAKLMRQGAWMPTPEPIYVDEELVFTVLRGKFDFLREQG